MLASLLTGLMSALAFCYVWAKGRQESPKSKVKKPTAFLADKLRALNFYRVFSAAYDILNPHLYTDSMRAEAVSLFSHSAHLRVLDVGCGTGYTTVGILDGSDACEVIGLDMNPRQLHRAAQKLKPERVRTSLSRGDAENLPFQDATFDAVVSVGAVEYFPDPEKALSEMARVAKANGKVVVGGPEYNWFRRVALHRFFYTPSRAEMEFLFEAAGLADVHSSMTGVKTFLGTSVYVVLAAGTKPAAS